MDITIVLLSIIGVIVGMVVGYVSGKKWLDSQTEGVIKKAEFQAQKLLAEATSKGEAEKEQLLQQAKHKYAKAKSDAERLEEQYHKKVEEAEKRIKHRETAYTQRNTALKQRETELDKKELEFSKRELEIERKKESLNSQIEIANTKRKALDEQLSDIQQQKNNAEQRQKQLDEQEKQLTAQQKNVETERELAVLQAQEKLEKIARMTAEDAKKELVASIAQKAEVEAMAYVKEFIEDAKLRANKEARKIIIQTIQRTAAEHTIENTVSVFNLESDDVKGQIIGREGRNIRALEAATGVEIIVDDTPEAIVISGYDPVRREVARLSLQRLVTDGRIHPARIEEVVAKTQRQIEQQIIEIGERTVIDLGINGMHPELVKIVGRMRYRSSYGQNLLQHSIETAKLCAVMAAELGLKSNTIKMAKRAGLLHDIGKVPMEETELSHALLGMKWAEKFGEHAAIVNAIGAHHDEIEMNHIISPIIQACDAISGARPGARREILESYLKRIAELEELAQSYEGVEKAYAVQAGRELRVIVRSEDVSDERVEELSLLISNKIQTEMQYPGQIKVTVIREKRAIAFAR